MSNYIEDTGYNINLTDEQKYNIITTAIRSNVAALRFIDTKCDKNKGFVHLALSIDPSALVYIDGKSFELYRYAVERFPESIKYIDPNSLYLNALIRDCIDNTFKHLDPNIFKRIEFNDDQMNVFLNKNKPHSIKFYIGKTLGIYLKALDLNPYVIESFSKGNWMVINMFLENDNYSTQLIREFKRIIRKCDNKIFDTINNNINYLEEELINSFIDKDPDNILYIKHFQISFSIIKYALNKKPELLKYPEIKKQIKNMAIDNTLLEIIGKNGTLIEHIPKNINNYNNFLKVAVYNTAYALNYIQNPSVELIEIAFNHDPDNFLCIKNETKLVKEYKQRIIDSQHIKIEDIKDVDVENLLDDFNTFEDLDKI